MRLGAVFMAVSLVLGCQAPGAIEPSNALESQPRVLVNYGKMKIEKETDLAISMSFMDILSRGYRVQNFVVGGVQRIVATVTGPNLPGPIVQEVQTVDCPSGEATFNFLKLAPGPVHVRIDVFDGAGNVVAWADGDTQIARGQTALLELECTINAGDLQVIFRCSDLCGATPTPTPTPTPSASPLDVATTTGAIASRYYHTTPPAEAFDNSLVRGWLPAFTGQVAGIDWIGQKFSAPKVIRHLRMEQGHQSIPDVDYVTSVTVQASSDGATWEDLETFSVGYGWNELPVSPSAAYAYYRILANSDVFGPGSTDTAWRVYEIEMFE